MTNLPQKHKNNSGHSTVELVMIWVLVLATILITGPYVVRSWFAHLKGMEDAIEDSFNDPFHEAPDDIDLPACQCDEPTPMGCGISMGDIQCNPRQMTFVANCYPLGCGKYMVPPFEGQAQFFCQYDDRCCEDTPLECGANATQITGQRADGLDGCEDGQRGIQRICGDNVQTYLCEPDPECIFICTGKPLADDYHYDALCPGDETALPSDTPSIFVPQGDCGVHDSSLPPHPPGEDPHPGGTNPKCEFQCADPFQPIFGNSACGCPPGTIEMDCASSIECPAGYIASDNSCLCPG